MEGKERALLDAASNIQLSQPFRKPSIAANNGKGRGLFEQTKFAFFRSARLLSPLRAKPKAARLFIRQSRISERRLRTKSDSRKQGRKRVGAVASYYCLAAHERKNPINVSLRLTQYKRRFVQQDVARSEQAGCRQRRPQLIRRITRKFCRASDG